MAVYDLSYLDNSTNIIDIIVGAGHATGNDYLIGYLALLAQFLIFLVLSYKLDIREVLILDGFLCTISAILLFVAGLVPATIIAAPAVLMFIVLIWHFTSES